MNMKKKVFAGFAPVLLLAVLGACPLTEPPAREEYVVSSSGEWNAAMREIGERGSAGKTYTIQVNADIEVPDVQIRHNIILKGSGTLSPLGVNVSFLFYVHDDGDRSPAHPAITLDGPTLKANPENDQAAVIVSPNVSFTMESGAVSGGRRGLEVRRGASFTMNGGTVSGNNGSGVDVIGGSFTMNGGSISGNASLTSGGGVYITGKEALFTMNGGTISGNTSKSGGGGVTVANEGSFTMKGGIISGNSASGHLGGGGVSVIAPGFFTKTGGAVMGNEASLPSSLRNTATGATYGQAVNYTVGNVMDFYCDTTLIDEPAGNISTSALDGPNWTKIEW